MEIDRAIEGFSKQPRLEGVVKMGNLGLLCSLRSHNSSRPARFGARGQTCSHGKSRRFHAQNAATERNKLPAGCFRLGELTPSKSPFRANCHANRRVSSD